MQVQVPVVRIHVPAEAMAALCAAVSADTGIPEGRVRKVIQAAQQHQQDPGLGTASSSGQPPRRPDATVPDSPAGRLRFYPLGANGRLGHPASAATA